MLRPLALCLLLAAPAAADQASWTWTPRTQDEALALRTGLALHALRQHVRGGGTVRQWGRDNAAALLQQGDGNWGAIVQRGEGHAATLVQTGGGNVGAVLQVGRGARAAVEQRGGEAGLTVQIGW